MCNVNVQILFLGFAGREGVGVVLRAGLLDVNDVQKVITRVV